MAEEWDRLADQLEHQTAPTITMTTPNPIPAGSKLYADRESKRPASVPKLPAS
jgi:hypothetical protein